MKSILRTVMRGELRYQLRDPLTVLLLVVVPLLVYPAMLYGMAKMGKTQSSKLEAQVLTVAGPPELEAWLQESDHLRLVQGELSDAVRPEEDAVLAVVEAREPDGFTLRYRGDVARSSRAMKRVLVALERWQEAELKDRFKTLNLPLSPAEVVAVTPTDVSPEKARAGVWLGRLIPLVLVFLLSSGGLHTALDVFTGEKDRGTLETLLTTRADRQTLLLGKFLVVLGFTVVSGLLALASLWACVALGFVKLPDEMLGAGASLSLDLSTVALLAAMAVPLSVQLAAVLSALAAWAPDFRAGQALSVPVVLLPAALAAVAAIPEVELGAATALLPIANIGLAAREALTGQLGLGLGLWVMCATAGHAALALYGASRLMAREDLILGSRTAAHRRMRGDYSVEALLLFALALLLLWFLGQSAQSRDMIWGMLFTQVALMAGPAFAMAFYLGLPVGQLFQLRMPRLADLCLAVLIGLGLPCFSSTLGALMEHVLPSPTVFNQQMLDALSIDAPLPVVLLMFAVLPGVCEELLFRGAILGLLRTRLRPVALVLVVGLLFGVMHLSLHRLVPTGALGVLLAIAALRSGSILVPMIIHALHNGVIMAATEGAIPFFDLEGSLWLPALVGLASVCLIALLGRLAPESAAPPVSPSS